MQKLHWNRWLSRNEYNLIFGRRGSFNSLQTFFRTAFISITIQSKSFVCFNVSLSPQLATWTHSRREHCSICGWSEKQREAVEEFPLERSIPNNLNPIGKLQWCKIKTNNWKYTLKMSHWRAITSLLVKVGKTKHLSPAAIETWHVWND